MELKKIHTGLIILIVIVVILSFYLSINRFSSSTLSVLSDSQINTTILKTSINKIEESSDLIAYRFRWFTDDVSVERMNIRFPVADFEPMNQKIISDVPNQFDVTGVVSFTGINQKLIKKQSAICDLVHVNRRPIISCNVHLITGNHQGNLNGYVDLVFRK